MIVRLLFALLIITSTGCTTTEALKNPKVWMPLVGAAVLQINDFDEDLSQKIQKAELLGGVEDAKNWSDRTKNWTQFAYISTAIAIDNQSLSSKVKLIASEWLVVETSTYLTREIKYATERERPDKSNNLSFPSGHTSTASVQGELANMNINYLSVSESTKRNLHWFVDSSAILTGYARVEAGRHYPSDVLVGYALGTFIGSIGGSFIKENTMILPQVGPEQIGLTFITNF